MKRRVFHCEKCGGECEIYRKGKKHRVLVCHSCGVLARNPSVLKSLAKRGVKAALGEIPGASLIMEGVGLVGDIAGSRKEKKSTPTTPQAFPPAQAYKNRFTTEERVALALR